MRNGRPFKIGDRVTLRRKLRNGDPTEGRIKAFDRDCFGRRAAVVVWDCGVYVAGEQMCLTSDLKRAR